MQNSASKCKLVLNSSGNLSGNWSGTCKELVRNWSETCQELVRNSSGTHQELVRNSSGTHLELVRNALGTCQERNRNSSETPQNSAQLGLTLSLNNFSMLIEVQNRLTIWSHLNFYVGALKKVVWL